MNIIYNKLIPFKGFKAVNLFGLCLVREEFRKGGPRQMTPYEINHERIHSAQGRELLWVGFYLIYLVEWLARLVRCPKRAYRSISFEREAYDHQHDYDYLGKRRRFAMWRR